MNFIEAALTLLQGSRKSLTAEELASRAQRQKLLDKPGKNPARSMKAALSRESGKGEDSRVVRVGDDRWKAGKKTTTGAQTTASRGKTAAGKKTAKKPAATKAAGRKTTGKKSAAKTAQTRAKTGAKKTRAGSDRAVEAEADKGKAGANKTASKKAAAKAAAARKSGKKASAKKSAGKKGDKTAGDDKGDKGPAKKAGQAKDSGSAAKESARPGKKGQRGRGKKAAEAQPDSADKAGLAGTEDVDRVLAPKERPKRAAEPVLPADDDIVELYSDELSGTEPGAAFAEYRDAHTDDEDRPMLPEIVAARREQKKRERRKKKRDRGQRNGDESRARRDRDGDQADQGGKKPARKDRTDRAPAQPAAAASDAAAAAMGFYRLGNPLADGAIEIMDTSRGGQPMQIKQLAQIMRKRELLPGRPENMWPHLKAALLADQASYRAHGLRSRIAYRGRELIERGTRASSSELDAAESAFIRAAHDLAQATHQALRARLRLLNRTALERVVHVYLLTQGWHNVEWVKQVQRSSYAVGEPPGGLGSVLVGVRAGSELIDRRGIGELRVGVQAKGLASGMLIAPQDLSQAAQYELRRPGPSISLVVGDSFISSLIQSGIGVMAGQLPALHFDAEFFDEVEKPARS